MDSLGAQPGDVRSTRWRSSGDGGDRALALAGDLIARHDNRDTIHPGPWPGSSRILSEAAARTFRIRIHFLLRDGGGWRVLVLPRRLALIIYCFSGDGHGRL